MAKVLRIHSPVYRCALVQVLGWGANRRAVIRRLDGHKNLGAPNGRDCMTSPLLYHFEEEGVIITRNSIYRYKQS